MYTHNLTTVAWARYQAGVASLMRRFSDGFHVNWCADQWYSVFLVMSWKKLKITAETFCRWCKDWWKAQEWWRGQRDLDHFAKHILLHCIQFTIAKMRSHVDERRPHLKNRGNCILESNDWELFGNNCRQPIKCEPPSAKLLLTENECSWDVWTGEYLKIKGSPCKEATWLWYAREF